jgi:ribonuclease BN (tRNA processing enzyme)
MTTASRPDRSQSPLSRRRLLGTSAAAVGAAAVPAQPAQADRADVRHAPSRPLAVPRDGSALCLLGTAGGPPPVVTRTGTASALSVRGRVYLVDCGRSAVTQYGRAGLRWRDLAGVFVTHLHIDHVADYANLVLLAAHGPNDVGDAAPRPFPVYGPGPAGALPPGHGAGTPPDADPTPGLRDLTEKSLQATAYSSNIFMRESGATDPGTRVQVHEVAVPREAGADPLTHRAPAMEPFPVMDDGTVRVSAVLVPHGLVYPSFAFRFDTPDGSVVFSGDTAPSENLVGLARDADILVHEAIDLDFYRRSAGYSQALLEHFAQAHTDVDRIGHIAQQCAVSTLVLTHLVPADTFLVPDASWHRRAQEGFSGRVVVGNDLDRIPLRPR